MRECRIASRPADDELIEVLAAVSIVSMRLAEKIAALNHQVNTKGDKIHGKIQRTRSSDPRTAKCRRRDQ